MQPSLPQGALSAKFMSYVLLPETETRGVQLPKAEEQGYGSLLVSVMNDGPGSTKAKVIALYAFLLTFNVGAWLWAFVAFHRFPVLLGTAFLAYSFGLRDAVDADHIAAIDNVTRKLMQQGKRPVAVGLMFSLGH